MSENLCPKCNSKNIKEYKNILIGAILLILMFPIGILYLILTPKYRCLECKNLFPRVYGGTKIGKIGNIFLILLIALLIFGIISMIWTLLKN